MQVVNGDRYCFSWLAGVATPAGANRAALLNAGKWSPGDVITASFLDGPPELWDRVAEAARLWTGPGLANLTFDFRRDTNDTHIRISFRYSGSWSVIGTTCRNIKDLRKPTMNFGWLTLESTQADVESVVLHEFGHALGLIHEHQHPENGIKWNKEKVYEDLSGPPNNWDKKTIDFNMFEAYSEAEAAHSTFDPHSIMMYAFPASWTEDGLSTGFNMALSSKDKRFIRQQYT